jgi:diguanylate cyclase (GGDEF)-like protein
VSIKLRLWIASAIVLACVAALGGLVAREQVLYQSELTELRALAAFRNGTEAVLDDVRDAETGQRGFLLVGTDRYLDPWNAANARVERDQQALRAHPAAADARVGLLVGQLTEAVGLKFLELGQTIALRREGGLARAIPLVQTDRGQELMERIREAHAELTRFAELRVEDGRRQLAALAERTRLALLLGFPTVLLVTVVAFGSIGRGLIRPLRTLETAMSRVTAGEAAPEVKLTGSRDFSRLAVAFNLMAARLTMAQAAQARSDRALAETNARLVQHGTDLERRTRTMEVMGRLAQRLPCCATMDEFARVVERFLPQILPGVPGGLFLQNHSGTAIGRAAIWGEPQGTVEDFAPADCWALRRGQPHGVHAHGGDVVCSHMHAEPPLSYCCIPLIAQGNTVGMLYLEAEIDLDSELIQLLGETVGLALAGLKLRDDLRNQSIRDGLTGLFNRRYLEESLVIEAARAERSGSPLGMIMLDVDHFKRFNDTHGHAAGDAVLTEVGAMLRRQIRKGDIACRYGGEEFVMLLPGATEAATRMRAEQIRAAAEKIRLNHRGLKLGAITVSLGVAARGSEDGDASVILMEADAALYAAKRAGRNQVVVAGEQPAPAMTLAA